MVSCLKKVDRFRASNDSRRSWAGWKRACCRDATSGVAWPSEWLQEPSLSTFAPPKPVLGIAPHAAPKRVQMPPTPVYAFTCRSLGLACSWSATNSVQARLRRTAAEHLRERHPGQSLGQSGPFGSVLTVVQPPKHHCAFHIGGFDDDGVASLCGRELSPEPVEVPEVLTIARFEPVWTAMTYGNDRMARSICPQHQAELVQRYVQHFLPLRNRRFARDEVLPRIACEVCWKPLAGSPVFSCAGGSAPDGIGRGFFCSAACREHGKNHLGQQAFYGAMHSALGVGDKVHAWPNTFHLRAEGGGSHEQEFTPKVVATVIRGTYARIDPEEWLQLFGAPRLIDGEGGGPSVEARGPYYCVDIECGGRVYRSCYTGWVRKAKGWRWWG